MAFFDKLTEFAVNVGDKANDALGMSKLNIQQKNEEKTLGELKQKLGELYLGMLRASGEVPQEVREVYEQIGETERRLAEVTAEIESKRAEEAAARAGMPNYDGVKCPSCGAENPLGTRFCAQCGTKIEAEEPKRFCAQCGAPMSEDSKFCSSCGAQQN